MQHRRRGRSVAAVSLALAMVTMGLAGPSAAATDDGSQWTKERVPGGIAAPPGANPYVAFTPDADADYGAWDTYMTHMSAGPRLASLRTDDGIRIIEETTQNNDDPRMAQRVGVSTNNAEGRGLTNLIGRGPDPIEGTETDAGFAAELNGSIPDAQTLPVLAVGDEVTGTGTIGDEDDFDFDFFELPGLSAGDTIVIDLDTPVPFGDLDPFVGFWGSDGPFPLLAVNDDGGADSFDSRLQVTVPADGTYYVSVGGFGAFVPADPFDSSSPSDTGAVGSEGDYSYSISSIQIDVDYYAFRLGKGDIIGANVFGAERLELYSVTREQLLIGSSQDLTFIHPASSPLPGGGNAALSYVIDETGWFLLGVQTSGDYVTELRSFRPVGDRPGRGPQVLFLDFDGGSVDTGIFGAPFGVRELSPLADFLPNWGLGPDDEDAVIDAIVASVEENIEHDIIDSKVNYRDQIVVLNSRDHAEPTGPLVSNIIVGGSIEEFGIGTVGIAQSIDVGNFETNETAVVLLDLLSAPVGSDDFIPLLSINDYEIDPSSSIIEAIGVGVGNVTAHEAGHFFANWHTDQFNDSPNIQDQGGNFPNTFGVGPDLIFGSADDVDVDFGHDEFVPAEGFSGSENTLTSIAFGLWAVQP